MLAVFKSVALALFVATICGCGEEGDPGEPGPIGERGPEGATGPTGESGGPGQRSSLGPLFLAECRWRTMTISDGNEMVFQCPAEQFVANGSCHVDRATDAGLVSSAPIVDGVDVQTPAQGAAGTVATGWFCKFGETGSHQVSILCCDLPEGD